MDVQLPETCKEAGCTIEYVAAADHDGYWLQHGDLSERVRSEEDALRFLATQHVTRDDVAALIVPGGSVTTAASANAAGDVWVSE